LRSKKCKNHKYHRESDYLALIAVKNRLDGAFEGSFKMLVVKFGEMQKKGRQKKHCDKED